MTVYALLACLAAAAVALRFESTEVTVSEGAGIVNLTIEKDGETTMDSRVLFRTVQSGTAMGKLLTLQKLC